MTPTTRFPLPTKLPKVSTTFPGSPVVRINFVEETFKEIRKIVVKSNKVGKLDMLNASLENKALNNTISEIEIFKANKTSKRIDGIGTIKKIIAASK